MATPIRYIPVELAIAANLDQIERYSGSAGVRDIGLLEAAMAVPRATYGGVSLCQDIYEMAAAYLYHLVQNHPFHDGNKRTGAAVAVVFLELNGIELTLTNDELVELVLGVATGQLKKPQITDAFKRASKPAL